MQTRAGAAGDQPCRENGTEITDQGWGSGVCEAKMHCGASIRTDQTGTRIPTVSLTRSGESTGRVGTDLHDAQHFEVSQDHLQWIAQNFPRSATENAVPGRDLGRQAIHET